MEQGGTQPDRVTWNSLLSGYSLNGHMKDALAVRDKMKTVGVGVGVSVTVYIRLFTEWKIQGFLKFLPPNAWRRQQPVPNSATICLGYSLQKGRDT